MTRTATHTRPDDMSRTLAADKLGVGGVLMFILSATTPLTVTSAVFVTGLLVTGLTGTPMAFMAIGLVLLVWAPGYVAMGRRIGNAGAFYSYVAHGLGRPLGVAAAWIALAAYNALQVGLYGVIGVAAGPLLSQWVGWDVSWWAVALAAWVLVAVLGVLHVDVNSKVLAVLLLAEIAAIVVFAFSNLAHPAGGTISGAALAPSNLIGPGFGAVLAIAVLGFVGIEGGVVYSEESRDPRRTVPVATFVAIAAATCLYTLSTWSQTVAVGPDRIVDRAAAEGPDMFYNLAGAQLGAVAVDIGRVLFVTSLIAAMIAFHNSVSRYTFALGREGVLPHRFGQVGRRTSAPVAGSLAQTLVGLLVIAVYAVAGWDPLVKLFFWGGTAGGVGVLLLITVTSIAVVGFFFRRPSNESAWRAFVLPSAATIMLLAVSYMALSHVDVLLGVDPTSPMVLALPVGIAVLAVLGVGWGLYLRAARPEVYAGIGRGAKAALEVSPGRRTFR